MSPSLEELRGLCGFQSRITDCAACVDFAAIRYDERSVEIGIIRGERSLVLSKIYASTEFFDPTGQDS
jgi:hypothetical protein